MGVAHETSKQATRRGADRRYATRWLVGEGIDIGCGEDPLGQLQSMFPLMRSVRPWDLPDGDAMLMQGVPDAAYDFVHSSHCLEHLVDPSTALANWIRICRPGGTLLITIPDEDLYEQEVWPSTFNPDHKWSFTVAKAASWSPKSVNVFDLVWQFIAEVDVLKIEVLDSGFQYGRPRQDQTQGLLSESAIEIVLRKKSVRADARQASPADAGALFAAAVTQHQHGRHAEAAALYRQVLARQPDDVAAMNNLALIANGPEAETLLRTAVGLNPGYMDARLNLGRLLAATGRVEEAATCFAAMIRDGATQGQVYLELGTVLEERQLDAEATLAFERALAIDPGLGEAAIRLAKLCERAGRTEAAIAYYDRVLALAPDHPEARVMRGFAHLKLGDYPTGAEGIAWLWRKLDLGNPPGLFAAGVDLAGRTIVLTADAGLGDALLFVRYASLLRARGAHVVVECQTDLLRLFAAQPAIAAAVPIGAPLPRFDHRVPMHDLIGAFGTTLATIPATVPYLTAPSAEVVAWGQRLGALPGLKVGLVWAGNPAHVHDARRSIDPARLAPLAHVPGVSFVSLQKGARWAGLADLSADLPDMAATAALVENLDLVITVDSSVAHLAGALGRPVWLLNRFDGCWRWLRDRDDSPWYPTLRQFRQTAPGDWDGVIAAASRALDEAAAGRRADHVASSQAA